MLTTTLIFRLKKISLNISSILPKNLPFKGRIKNFLQEDDKIYFASFSLLSGSIRCEKSLSNYSYSSHDLVMKICFVLIDLENCNK